MAKTDKIWRDAIMRAVRRLGEDQPPEQPTEAQRLDLLADALVAKGIMGDVPAIREVGDRLDGKATQPISGDDDAPPVRLSMIEMVAVKPGFDVRED